MAIVEGYIEEQNIDQKINQDTMNSIIVIQIDLMKKVQL